MWPMLLIYYNNDICHENTSCIWEMKLVSNLKIKFQINTPIKLIPLLVVYTSNLHESITESVLH